MINLKIIQCVLSIVISISKPRNSQHPHNMSDSFVPIVPFESYQEYEDGLSELINTYRDMVDASTRENSGSLSKSYGDYSIEWVVKANDEYDGGALIGCGIAYFCRG